MSTITLDETFHNYFKDLFIEYVICENCSSVSSEKIKATFTVCSTLKEYPSFLKILLQRETFDIVDRRSKKKECKVAIPSIFLIKIHSGKEKK